MISSYKNPKQIKNSNKNRKPVYKPKQKTTIIEILAVLIIIIIAIIVLNPYAVRLRDNMNKKQYIVNVNTYIDRAIEMYNSEEYKDAFIKSGDTYTIKFTNIDGVNIKKDPYGFDYINDESYVVFSKKSEDIIVNAKSCATIDNVKYCYEIVDINTKDLDTNSIKTSIN